MSPSATSRLLALSQATDTGHSLPLASPAAPLGSEFHSMAGEGIGACHIEKITEDGILCNILSYLTMREALRTSVLSSRWKRIWEYIPNLHFDSLNVLGIYDLQVKDDKVRNEEKFISFLNEFMKHHQAIGVEKFIIHFPLNKKHADHLNKWVDFGVASGAKEFRLILNEENLSLTELYDFPCQLFAFGRGSSIEQLHLEYVALKVPENFDGFAYVKDIDLGYMAVNDGDIWNLLCGCPVLERMHISMCQNLVNLIISHRSLKDMKVIQCSSLERIELSAENLTSFKYIGRNWINGSFQNTPRLTNALFDILYSSNTIYYPLTRLPVDLPQLESLTLPACSTLKVFDLPVNINKFTHLKHLVVPIQKPAADHLLWLASLLNAAPFVEKLELHLVWSPRVDRKEDTKEREVEPSKCPHKHLKTAEITGFTGIAIHMEIATYLLNNTTCLELMIINGRQTFTSMDGELIVRDIRPGKIREKVRRLQKKASSTRILNL